MKEKIKIQAISIFNSNGISNVSMKQIADSLGISAGNLSYHYKTKAILLNCIYEEMHASSLGFILPKNSYITLHHFEKMMLQFGDLQFKYSFFFNEIVHIGRNYPNVAKLYTVTTMQRFKEGKTLIDYYIETNRLNPENKQIDYNKLIHSFWMISTFWQSQRQVIKNAEYTINQCHFIELLWNILIPYLTEKGLEEYHQMRKFVTLPKD